MSRISDNYNRWEVATELFNNSMTVLDYKIHPSNYYFTNNLSSFWQLRCISNTVFSVLNHQFRAPDVVSDILREQNVEKEEFRYPMPDEPQELEPEVDIAALKKDAILTKLRTHGQSYKQMPEEMYRKLQ